ncbi:p-aminobenzoyl-glutamate transporter [Planctomycetales bacterium 10988]|nr:p-aminobenzoyl-glutamate transporter [Planctomycetales bacterium 10988]
MDSDDKSPANSTPTNSTSPQPAEQTKTRFAWLDWIERWGNRLPDPVSLFIIAAVMILLASEWAAQAGWQQTNPVTGKVEQVKSLLSQEGMEWVWLHLVENFTGFPPLGVVLVAMLGIGVAERSGLLGTMLKAMVLITPAVFLTPVLVFVGVMSSFALDAGYVVLPPLAAAVFLRAGRAPLVGLAAVFAGVSAGFSANLFITSLDPLLQSFTQLAAATLDPNYIVDIRCNYYFMIVSTILITFVGWAVTHWVVEPRFSQAEIREMITAAEPEETSVSDAPAEPEESKPKKDRLSWTEWKGLLIAGVTIALSTAGIVFLIVSEGGSLSGTIEPRPGWEVEVWVEAIVPILFVLFLLPGIAYGIAVGTIRSDRDFAKMMAGAMQAMGTYIVLAFFAAQFISWFNESNLGTVFALQGIAWLQQLQLPLWLLVIAMVILAAILNLVMGSASAKWAFMSTVFVPIFAGIGISPELTQAAYRVGDSVTNGIAPLNPYLVLVLVVMQKYRPKAGIGSLISLMLPYTIAFFFAWVALLLVWMAFDWQLGPGRAPLFIEPIAGA